MNKINWEETKAKLDGLDWSEVSERWETRQINLGSPAKYAEGKETSEDMIQRLDLIASKLGLFLELGHDDPENLYISQGRLRTTAWHPSNQKGSKIALVGLDPEAAEADVDSEEDEEAEAE